MQRLLELLDMHSVNPRVLRVSTPPPRTTAIAGATIVAHGIFPILPTPPLFWYFWLFHRTRKTYKYHSFLSGEMCFCPRGLFLVTCPSLDMQL